MAFTPDDKIRQVAEAYALDAVDLLRQSFSLSLDWSDASVRHVEKALGRLHDETEQEQPSEEQVFQFAKVLGSYIGEVFRRNHGAEWGIVGLGDETFPGLRAQQTGTEFWPWGKAHNRLVNGPEDNVWHYYQVLVSKEGGTPPLKQVDLGRAKQPWWRKILGGA